MGVVKERKKKMKEEAFNGVKYCREQKPEKREMPAVELRKCT